MDSLADELKTAGRAKGIACLEAWEIARRRRITRRAVGKAIDDLDIRIVDCQLGCFGASKATHEELSGSEPAEPIRSRISASLKEGRLPCSVAHGLARKLNVTPREVGDTATLMSVKISQCQLGCF